MEDYKTVSYGVQFERGEDKGRDQHNHKHMEDGHCMAVSVSYHTVCIYYHLDSWHGETCDEDIESGDRVYVRAHGRQLQ